MAGANDGKRESSGGGSAGCDIGNEWGSECGAGGERGANPPGVCYTVVYQLGPGEVRTEYWMVPTRPPATPASCAPGSGNGGPAAVREFGTRGQGE